MNESEFYWAVSMLFVGLILGRMLTKSPSKPVHIDAEPELRVFHQSIACGHCEAVNHFNNVGITSLEIGDNWQCYKCMRKVKDQI